MKPRRLYRIQQKSTGLFFQGVFWDHNVTPSERKAYFVERGEYSDIEDVNKDIKKLIEAGMFDILDDVEIITYQTVAPKIIKGSIRIKAVRDRIEQKAIVNKLKNGR